MKIDSDYKYSLNQYKDRIRLLYSMDQTNLNNGHFPEHKSVYDFWSSNFYYEQYLFRVGLMYYFGYKIDRDYDKAIDLLEKAFNKGSYEAGIMLGLIYCNNDQPDYKKAELYFRDIAMITKPPSIEHGDASYNYGIMLYNGHSGPVMIKEAFDCFTNAKNCLHSGARYNLGLMFEKGQGCKKDKEESIKWISIAAERGYSPAQYYMGLMLSEIIKSFLPKDIKKAIYWHKKAAGQGHKKAINSLLVKNKNIRWIEILLKIKSIRRNILLPFVLLFKLIFKDISSMIISFLVAAILSWIKLDWIMSLF